ARGAYAQRAAALSLVGPADRTVAVWETVSPRVEARARDVALRVGGSGDVGGPVSVGQSPGVAGDQVGRRPGVDGRRLTLFQRHDEAHRDGLRGLWRHRAESVGADHALHAQNL